jgi:hypothetical protein
LVVTAEIGGQNDLSGRIPWHEGAVKGASTSR